MKRLLLILAFVIGSTWCFAQDDMRVVDSLENVLVSQQGSEKIKTMIQMVWAFYDVAFDEGIDWGEKAIQMAQEIGESELEAEATYAIGVQYGYHNDLELAQKYLKEAFPLYEQAGNEAKAFDALWYQAYFELLLGNLDTAYSVFQKAMVMAEQRHDSLACAQISTNLGAIQFQKNDFNGAIEAFQLSRDYYEALNDSIACMEVNLNLAITYSECGRIVEARSLFVSLIPLLETNKRYYYLLLAYENYGLLLERGFAKYDSACYYLEKALAVTELEDISRQYRQTMVNTKADVLTELGNVAAAQKQPQQAILYYEEALSLAEYNCYHFGQMQAMVGLGQLYAQQGQATKSLYYLEKYSEKALRSGITLMEAAVKKSRILDYARLGRYVEMEKELDDLDEQRAALTRENADISNQIRELRNMVDDLVIQHEAQNNQIQTLQSQRDHYRLAFFGLMAIVLAVLVLLVVYKIVCKNRAKTK